jgi:hypothetical protein
MMPAQVKSAASSITTCVLEWPIDIRWKRRSGAWGAAGSDRGRWHHLKSRRAASGESGHGETRRALYPSSETASDPASPPRHYDATTARVGQRAQALVREQLANGPRLESQIEAAAEAAEIPPRSLIAAADALGERCRQGQWWLPG